MLREKFTPEEIDFLSRAYDLDFTPNQEFPEKGDKNQVVFLTDSNASKYVVKKYSYDFTPQIAEFQLRLNDFVYACGVPTPKILKSINGENLTTFENNLYSLMTFVEGRHPRESVQSEINLAFHGLARFNLALGQFENLEEYEALPRFFKSHRRLLEELEPHLPRSACNDTDEYVLSQVSRVREMISTVEERLPKLGKPKQLIHGDFNLGCALINNGKLVAVVDYDLVRMDFRGTDAIHTSDLYCFDKETKDIALDDRVDWDKLKECFSEYRKFDPSIRDQIESLPLMLADVGLNSLIVTWGEGYLPTSSDAERDYFSRRYDFFNNRTEIALGLEKKLIKTLKNA
ncbi:MAG: phosphotransferase [Candidatus Woesearchaeota archaeon]